MKSLLVVVGLFLVGTLTTVAAEQDEQIQLLKRGAEPEESGLIQDEDGLNDDEEAEDSNGAIINESGSDRVVQLVKRSPIFNKFGGGGKKGGRGRVGKRQRGCGQTRGKRSPIFFGGKGGRKGGRGRGRGCGTGRRSSKGYGKK